MQTASVPSSASQVSTRSSPKKCDFPEPLPPYAPLYRAGTSRGAKILAVRIFRMDNDALDSVDQLERAVGAVLDGLRRLAPAAIQDGVGGGNLGRGGGVLACMTPTRTLSAVLVWLRASERISVMALGLTKTPPTPQSRSGRQMRAISDKPSRWPPLDENKLAA